MAVDPILAALLGVLGGLVVASVAWAIFRRLSASRPITDVDELAVEVERMGRVLRRLNMQAVRRAPESIDLAAPPPPGPARPGVPVTETKADLRRRVFSMR